MAADRVRRLFREGTGSPLPTSWTQLDSKLRGGLRKGRYTLITGATGIGKTPLVCGWSMGWLARRLGVLFIDSELGEDDVWLRFLGLARGEHFEDTRALEGQEADEAEQDARDRLDGLWVCEWEGDLDACLDAYGSAYGRPPDVVVFDNISTAANVLIAAGRSAADAVRLVCHGLRKLAKLSYVVAVAHPGRRGEEARDSGMVENNSNCWMVLGKSADGMKLKIRKATFAPFPATAGIVFNGDLVRFDESAAAGARAEAQQSAAAQQTSARKARMDAAREVQIASVLPARGLQDLEGKVRDKYGSASRATLRPIVKRMVDDGRIVESIDGSYSAP